MAATLKCCGARARVLSTQEFAVAPQPELCGLRSGCGRRACAGKAGPRLCTRQEPSLSPRTWRDQPAWRLRGRGPAGTRAPGTTPGRAPDDRDGTVLWSGRRAHPADVPEPPSAAANRGEAPLPGGRRGRSAGYERPAAPARLMRRAPRPLGAPGRRRGGRGFPMHARFPLTAGIGDHSTWIPQVSMAATLR